MATLVFAEQREFETTRENVKEYKPFEGGGEIFMDKKGESNGNRTPGSGTTEGSRDDSYQTVASG
jgi:hypothetical protein